MQRNELAALDKLLKPVLAAHPGAYDVARLLAESQFRRGDKKASAEVMVKAARASGTPATSSRRCSTASSRSTR